MRIREPYLGSRSLSYDKLTESEIERIAKMPHIVTLQYSENEFKTIEKYLVMVSDTDELDKQKEISADKLKRWLDAHQTYHVIYMKIKDAHVFGIYDFGGNTK